MFSCFRRWKKLDLIDLTNNVLKVSRTYDQINCVFIALYSTAHK